MNIESKKLQEDLVSQPARENIIDRFLMKAYSLIESVCKLMLMVMVLVVAYTVFARFVLRNSPSWGEELGIFCLVWIALLSISLGVQDGRHIRMTLLELFIPKKRGVLLDKFGHLFILLVGLVLLIEGYKLTLLSSRSVMPAMGISLGWLYLSLPVAGLSILLMLVKKVRDGQW